MKKSGLWKKTTVKANIYYRHDVVVWFLLCLNEAGKTPVCLMRREMVSHHSSRIYHWNWFCFLESVTAFFPNQIYNNYIKY
jgi:hypothetical protein